RLQAFVEGKFFRALFRHFRAPLAFAGTESLAEDERAVTLLQCMQFWKSLLDREPRRISGIYTSDQRINRIVQEFLPEPAHDKFRDALLGFTRRPPDKRFAKQSQLRAGREQRRFQKAAEGTWHFHRLSAANQVALLRAWFAVKPALFPSQIRDQRSNFGRSFEDGVRAAFREKPALANTLDDATHARACLIDNYGNAA